MTDLSTRRFSADLLDVRATLAAGILNPIEQARATAKSLTLHATLLDSIAFPAPKLYSALELMRFSAELLQVRASLEAGQLSAIEQVRTSARGLELRSILGASVPISLSKPQKTIDQATIDRALSYSSAVSAAEIEAFIEKLNTNIAALKVAGIGGETLRLLQDKFDDMELYGEWKAGKAQLVDTPKPAEVPSGEAGAGKQSIEVAGLTIKIPAISKELESSYNRATHMGRGRDFNAELAGDITSLVTDLAKAKHTLETPEQKAEAVALVEEYARRSVKNTNQDLVAGANNPSWFVTGRSGRNMAKVSDRAERQADRSAEAFGNLSKFRDSIAKTLYSMRPAEIKQSQALSADMRSIADYAGMFAGYEQNKQAALAADARKWASPKALKLIERSLVVDADGTRAALKIIDDQVKDQGGMVALFGARSGAGKLLAQLLADQSQAVPAAEPEPTNDPAIAVSSEIESPPAVEPEIKPDAEPPAPVQHDIIEYTTKRGKVLRGIVRTDLSQAEAKAIDQYTWRMNGGYFIREEHLGGDTAHIQAAPAPVVLSPEQQAEKAANDERLAAERRQQALSAQVEKLRAVADKAIEGGEAGMGQDRLTNTARRAGMAASAIAKASANKADGQTLNNIADAIEVGAGGLLTKLSSRAQLEELQRALRLAQYETDRRLSYSEQLKRKGRPFDDEDLKNMVMPSQVTWASRYSDAAKIIAKKSPTGNARLIAALYKMGARAERFTMNPEDAAITRRAYDVLKGLKEGYTLQDPVESIARQDRLARMGITDAATLREAARELLPMMVAKTEESAVKKAERAIIGQKVGIDFFPTPANVAQRMARLAGISKGTRVLEPSAGNGNLADAAKADGGEVDVIEISSQLRDILTAKGYNVVDHDFDGFTPEQPYEAILMNPPFSQRRDAAHIMRAYGMLASGGRLVAIAGEGVFFGTDQKAVAFREWLDTHNATVEKLDGGTFKDKELLAQTGANARLIILKK